MDRWIDERGEYKGQTIQLESHLVSASDREREKAKEREKERDECINIDDTPIVGCDYIFWRLRDHRPLQIIFHFETEGSRCSSSGSKLGARISSSL